MKQRMVIAALIFVVVHGVFFAIDPCYSVLPASLVSSLHKTYPDFRCPQSSDMSKEEETLIPAFTPNTCSGVVSADFDGDGQREYVSILTSQDAKLYWVIISKRYHKRWSHQAIGYPESGRGRAYLRLAKPGKYADMYTGTEEPHEINNLLSLYSRNPGFILGRTEAVERAYFCINDKWVYLQLSD